MNEKALQLIQEAFSQAKPAFMASGTKILLTPPSVKSDRKPSKFSPQILPGIALFAEEFNWKVPSFTPRWEFIVKFYQLATLLGENIYMCNLNFPDQCCKCNGEVMKFEIVEVGEQPFTQKFGWKEIWFTLPFCSQHDLRSKSVHIQETKPDSDGWKRFEFGIYFTNQDYGKAFGQLNRISGKWLTRNALLARDLVPYLLIGWFCLFFVSGIILYGGISAASITVTTIVILLFLMIVGLTLAILSIRFWLKFGRGQK